MLPKRNTKHRSPASTRRNIKRKEAWTDRCLDRHSDIPEDRIWLLHRIVEACELSVGPFHAFQQRFKKLPVKSGQRHRDVFPLGVVDLPFLNNIIWAQWRKVILLKHINWVIVALNYMFGLGASAALPARPTAAQQDVQNRVKAGCVDFFNRLCAAEPPSSDGQSNLGRAALLSDRVDCLEQAGRCNALEHLSPDVQAVLNDPALLFSRAPPGLEEFDDVDPRDRAEYVKLVAKQLRCGQLGLASSIRAGGTVFPVGKPTGKLRAVWHGKRVSQAAIPPPLPRHLASPSALLHLEASKDRPVRVSKRDARCWFDQLQLPRPLREWMGRPAVTLTELAIFGGIGVEEAKSFLEEGSGLREHLHPVSKVWPMGFSWSSFVAQEKLLDFFAKAGLDSRQVLACDTSTPDDLSLVFAAATDDAMFFSNQDRGTTTLWARAFDEAMLEAGAFKHSGKDVDDELNATCVGVCLEEGMFLGIPPRRCLSLTFLVLGLVRSGVVTRKDVFSVLSTMQWYDLLMRGKFSVYVSIYPFVADFDDPVPRRIPAQVLDELLLGLLLGIYWKIDLTRQFLPSVFASDASVEFGFGASYAKLDKELVRAMARVAEKQGDLVVLDGNDSQSYSSRLGQPHKFGLPKSAFTHILSVKRKRLAHINILEGEAFVFLLRWILRARARHSARVVILVDSAVWLGAAAKGRSSTALNRLLRKVAALQMAGNLMLYLVLVPSAENPSDAPLRGTRFKRKIAYGKLSLAGRLQKKLKDMKARYVAAMKAYQFDSDTDSDSSLDTESLSSQ